MNGQDQNQTQEPNEKPMTQQETADAIANVANKIEKEGTTVGESLKSVASKVNGDLALDNPANKADENHMVTQSPDVKPGGPMLTSVDPSTNGGQAQVSGPANLASAQTAELTPQQEFDQLVERKKRLWVQIRHLDHEQRSLTATQLEIDEIDQKMMSIWLTYPGQIVREEEK